jgi:hypothetical protein
MHGPATDQPGANGALRVGDGAAELVVLMELLLAVLLIELLLTVLLV